ncbi:PaaI family thioesterase [Peribacillus frigoritolerans]|uniref:PaaI family thioesterase n=1 Tax=Peribacillus frigoritolerans TaxID=450367 RepID=UPI00227E3C86|nr:PaaI family thioesterase [Peribacillus frigoritolerans]MCY8938236.1 PaaI family thioesterase [Peribacillus frigoritolerans]
MDKVDLKERYESSPLWDLIGIKVDSLESNQAKIRLSITKPLLNGNQVLHGGIFSTLLDAAMGINFKLRVGEVKFATISLTTQYLKPAKEGETLFATAEVLQQGKIIASIEARIVNERGELVSIGLATFKITRSRS